MVINLNLDALAAFVLSPAFTVLWGGVMLLYGLWWTLSLLWEKRRLIAEVAETTRLVKQTRDGRAFAMGFMDVTARVMIMPRIKNPWKDFVSGVLPLLHPPQDTDEGQRLRQALRICHMPSEYFNEETLLNPWVDPLSYGKIPAHLGAMGILGTFCGLAAGIYLAREGLSGGDLKQLLFSLSSMLKGASLGFSTSILGILGGMVFSHFERASLKGISLFIHQLNQALMARLDLASYEKLLDSQGQMALRQEQILLALLQEMKHLNADKLPLNKEALAVFLEDTKEALGQIITTMNQEVQRALQEMTALMRKEEVGLATLMEEPLLTTLDKIQGIQRSLHQQWQEHHQRFQEVDQSLGQAFSNTSSSIVAFSDRFKDLTKAFDQHLSKGIHSLSSAVGDLHEVIKGLGPACDKISQTLEKRQTLQAPAPSSKPQGEGASLSVVAPKATKKPPGGSRSLNDV